ncbi:sensor histidine kinase [Spongiactinospora sp. TRM90649]|uniref:sensor histidine kinase n=1 Tax=Spongiactinospora sp. TRM90649 TaxID=3031114 RepID=UPI0023F941FD|nr:sensor histidine kinase [Spongiactinospora sp. TRM90649]MDF5757020.1 sensor histidine kinase [Spongiactinospora sp. TRM90649]
MRLPRAPKRATYGAAPPAPGVRGPEDAPSVADTWWGYFLRRGPYVLLALASVSAAFTMDLLMTGTEVVIAMVLIALALTLHVWWSTGPERRPVPSAASQVYYALRYLIGFALTWLNPFFAIYALLGYFDAGPLLPRRLVRAGLVATAVTMSGSQSGGLPPSDRQWPALAAIFVINASLSLFFEGLTAKETEHTAASAATISELRLANARLEQALAENAGLQARLLAQAREAGVNEERTRLAAEIHDTIAQGLTGIVTQLEAAADSADQAASRDHIARATALARHSLGEARRSVHDLGPGQLEHDALPEALEKIVVAWSAETGVPAAFTVTGHAEPLLDEVEATLLRIAQEALANVGRHAAATRAGVTLSYMDDEVSLDVRDDGRGFDLAAVRPADGVPVSGFGLRGMRARTERIAGELDIESEPGAGTAVSARVPLVRHD